MKIIHTSDWHIGQNFYGYDRREEHNHMIEQLASLIKKESPDLLIIAGDIYDVAVPSTTVMKDFARYMVTLRKACEDMTIVCIAGNHDSASRHEVFQEPWEAFDVRTVGKLNLEDYASNIIRIKDKGYVVAVPYTNERFLTDDFYQKMEDTAKEICTGDLPVVFVGHSSITDCDYDGHDKSGDKYIGNIECTDISRIGSFYDYVALGHIHKAQTLGGGRARYSGSPVPVSFDEVKSGYEHGFTVVEIDSHGAMPMIDTIEVSQLKPLVNLPWKGVGTWSDAMEDLKSLSPDKDVYVRLNVEVQQGESLPYDREVQIANVMKDKKGRYCLINVTRKNAETAGRSTVISMDLEELQQEDPLNLIRMYFASAGKEFTPEFEEMFNEAYEAVKKQNDEN